MKRLSDIAVLVIASLLLCACSAYVSDASYGKALRGETVQEFAGFTGGKDVLMNATLLALQKQGWTVQNTGNPIKAERSELRQHAKVSIKVEDNMLTIDTNGSLVDGNKAYVPVAYLDDLTIAIRKYTLKQ